MIWWLVLAGGAGWTFDDWCPTPPRPPFPWPWWSKKAIAVIGGIIAYYVVGPHVGAADNALTTVLVGGIGGVVLTGVASLGARATPGA